MGMRRNQFLGGIGKCMCFLAVCVMTFSSCYNDDDLKNSISGLEDRMDKLEASLQSVQTDISTLKNLEKRHQSESASLSCEHFRRGSTKALAPL